MVDDTACRDSWGKQWVSVKGIFFFEIALVWTHPSRHARRLHAVVWSTSTFHGGKGQFDVGHAEPITRHGPDDPRRSSTETKTFSQKARVSARRRRLRRKSRLPKRTTRVSMRVFKQRFELTIEKVLLVGAPGLLRSVTVRLRERNVSAVTPTCWVRGAPLTSASLVGSGITPCQICWMSSSSSSCSSPSLIFRPFFWL